MNTGKKYHTRQKEMVLTCIQEHAGDYITIQQLAANLSKKGCKIGLTTIYRNLAKLEEECLIARVTIDGIRGTCYRYRGSSEQEYWFSMKCEQCGSVVDIPCSELKHLYQHVSTDHQIQIDAKKTMFYGLCTECQRDEQIQFREETT